jgi:cytochrome oxidase Cu insertion factor (SCO1/SenC/PrrC family)
MNDKIEVRGKPRLELWALIIVCAFPVVFSWLFYMNTDLLPKQQVNHGDLIEPQLPIPSLELQTLNGQKTSLSSLKGSWTLVKLGGNSCDKACQQHIHDLQQIRRALGEDMQHIERLLILSSPQPDDEFRELIEQYQGMLVVSGNDTAFRDFLSNFENFEGRGKEGIYIIDPMGNLMMHYSSETNAKDILNDMERLLMATKHWLGKEEQPHQT